MANLLSLSCLADPTRRAVFEALRAGPKNVSEIASGLPVSRPAVSQHLKALSEAGLVAAEARGAARYYRIERAGLAELRSWIEGFWDEPLARFKAHAEGKHRERKHDRRKD